MISTPQDDQMQTAIRDASAWVDTNDRHSAGYIPREQAPPGYQAIYAAFQESQPLTHEPCEHLASSGPQVAHWFVFWPSRAFCTACAVQRMKARFWPRRSHCLVCRSPRRRAHQSEVTFGNVVLHGPLCRMCGGL